MFFGPGGLPLPGVNTPLPHSAPNAATSPFYKNPFVINPNAYPGAPGIHNPRRQLTQVGTNYKGGGDYFLFNFAALRQRFLRQIAKSSMVRSRAICATNT